MDELTFVTVCRGRLEQLRQTLPRLLEFKVPVVVVDYDCPQLKFMPNPHAPHFSVVRSGPRPFMNLNEARNIGIRAAKTFAVCVVDCDVLVGSEDMFEQAEQLQYQHSFCRVRPPNGSLSGTTMFRLSDYVALGGYDEAINRFGPGYDEIDFYHRLVRSGVRETYFATDSFRHIEHGEHASNYPLNHRQLSDQLNQIYLLVKTELLNMFGPDTNELEYQYRMNLMDQIGCEFLTKLTSLACWGDESTEYDRNMELTIQVGESMVGAAKAVRHLKYRIDVGQILKKCELTREQLRAIVGRVEASRKMSPR